MTDQQKDCVELLLDQAKKIAKMALAVNRGTAMDEAAFQVAVLNTLGLLCGAVAAVMMKEAR